MFDNIKLTMVKRTRNSEISKSLDMIVKSEQKFTITQKKFDLQKEQS